MKRIILTISLLQVLLHLHATWSIIVIDPVTKQIGIAGASCTYSVYGIGTIVPGKGAVVVQAMSNSNARAKGIAMLQAGAEPAKIMAAMMDARFDPENQQYAIVCVNYPQQPVTYTGTATTPFKGTLTANGVSVQGNTLTRPEELEEIMHAVVRAREDSLPIEDVLMLALEAGARFGGDKRCGETKAISAFVTVANPADNINRPCINLIVNQTGENVNAVQALRKKFDTWKARRNNGNSKNASSITEPHSHKSIQVFINTCFLINTCKNNLR